MEAEEETSTFTVLTSVLGFMDCSFFANGFEISVLEFAEGDDFGFCGGQHAACCEAHSGGAAGNGEDFRS